MKRLGLSMAGLLLSVVALFAGNDRVTQDISELPNVSRQFISAYFNEVDISHLKIERGLLGVHSYDVILMNGITVEFNRSGEWTEIDGHQNVLPAAVIPQAIHDYMKSNFADRKVMSIEKERREYKVELDTGLELVFSKSGVFKGIDD